MTVPLRSRAGPSLSVISPSLSSTDPSPYIPDSFSPGLSARILRFRECALGDETADDPNELDRRGGGFLLGCDDAAAAAAASGGCLLLLPLLAWLLLLLLPGSTADPLLLPASTEWPLEPKLETPATAGGGSRSWPPRLDAPPRRRRLRSALSLLLLLWLCPVLDGADDTEDAAVEKVPDGLEADATAAFPGAFGAPARRPPAVADPTLPDDDATDAAE
jgi:hypothetical protein